MPPESSEGLAFAKGSRPYSLSIFFTWERLSGSFFLWSSIPVSYTHLDVYKRQMQELSRMLTGTYLQNYESLRHAIHEDSRQKDVIQLSSDNHVFYFPDGSVWMFQEYPLKEPSLDGYLQTVAVNVSEIYYNGEEIKNNNEKLEFLNRKLEEMYEKIGDEIREQETLSMKMQVHDSFGRSLLSIRRILEKKEEPENMKEQLDTLKQLVYILTGTTVEKGEDQYKDTEKQAEKLGITLQIRGSYPNDPVNRLLTDRAIRELSLIHICLAGTSPISSVCPLSKPLQEI